MPLGDNNSAQVGPLMWTRAYTGITTEGNNEDNRDEEEEVNITW
jgi:hypothetical protein